MRRKLQRISLLRRRQLRCQASASAFIPSVIGFSATSPSVVGLRLPFPLFVIVPVALSCPRSLLESAPAQVKMVYSDYVKQRILFYRRLGKSFVQITRCLAEEGHVTTKVGVYKFIRRYEETGMISRTQAVCTSFVDNLLTLARSVGVS